MGLYTAAKDHHHHDFEHVRCIQLRYIEALLILNCGNDQRILIVDCASWSQ